MNRIGTSLACLLCACIAQAEPKRAAPPSGYRDWRIYGGGWDRIRYSALDQINRDNVGKLRAAWRYDTGDEFPESEMQCNPIVVDGVLFGSTPKLRIFALDAATGKLRWRFDPYAGEKVARKKRNRGVTYWAGGSDRRIYFAAEHYLYALDAGTGAPVKSFGDDGRVDLRQGFGRDVTAENISVTTPGVVYKDLLILGSITSEDLPAAPGDIRAFDVKTGKLRWSFHTVPKPGEYGADTWPKGARSYLGGANNWCGMALDEKRGLLFAPTGSAAFDFYGANRTGDNLFANTLLALKADTGERVWHFQAIKHDVWDRDFPTTPSLVTVRRDGRLVDAVAQATKSGHLLVFERETGKPLFPIEYRRVPKSDVEGEVLAETQPFPLQPPPFARQELTEEMLTRRTPEAHRAVLEKFRKIRSGPQFTPPSLEGTVVFPGFDGGAEWGGQAFDPETGLYYVNSNEMPWILRLVKRQRGARGGRAQYIRNCASCHKEDLSGTPPEFPSLKRASETLSRADALRIVREGKGRMPGFAHRGEKAVEAMVDYVLTGVDKAAGAAEESSPMDLEYTHDGYNKFLDPDGYPAVEPPWGTLNAINLDTGEIAWKIPFGEFPELAAKGLKNTGTENYGGPVVTAGGLLFIGATNHDRKFRAFDKVTGELLWETLLPAAGNATPAVYEVNGRQFVVIAAGGGKSGAPSGGSYVAFTLPAGR
ncbi:MAG: PQQ-binding-like beta-propeller repeat protein [Bryobacteraceae bacterium]|nr:PQQ-binding-like beta-propeller repeat protein [Bryobacteraceae bacterium]